MKSSANDVEPRLFASVIREMIRHENDVTNHRIMWLLIGQGLIANAYVSAGSDRTDIVSVVAPVGILVALSAFLILYKSYQARGYLEFLGNDAKRGTLLQESLPLFGWPRKRIQGWHRKVWLCPWLGQANDLLEPYLFLPSLLILAWLFVLLQHQFSVSKRILLVLSMILTVLILAVLCLVWVWWQCKDEEAGPLSTPTSTQSSSPESRTT
jgi:hypothetical protein